VIKLHTRKWSKKSPFPIAQSKFIWPLVKTKLLLYIMFALLCGESIYEFADTTLQRWTCSIGLLLFETHCCKLHSVSYTFLYAVYSVDRLYLHFKYSQRKFEIQIVCDWLRMAHLFQMVWEISLLCSIWTSWRITTHTNGQKRCTNVNVCVSLICACRS